MTRKPISMRSLLWQSLCIACGKLFVPSSAFVPLGNAFVARRVSLAMADADSNNELMESLRARQLELESQEELRYDNWRTAKCESSIPIALPDWVRRIDLEYPLVACGSASGTVFVAHVETGEILAQSERQEEASELEDIESILRMLYGAYDGGGTIAIAVQRNLICSAGRQGSVQIHRYDKSTNKLISQGSMQALEGVLVTCLQLDEDLLWIGTSDGRVLAYPHSDDDNILSLQNEPAFEFNVASPILSLSISPSIGYGVAATAKGSVELFSMEDDDRILASWYPPFDTTTRQSSNTYPLSATLVSTKDGGYRLACGASDGSLYLHTLRWEHESLDEDRPLTADVVECAPKHQGSLKCLATPNRPDLLISGGQDGSIRMWDVSEAICLYQFMGYKVWLGSVWTDGIRMVSDGADNTIVVHNFDAQQPDGNSTIGKE